jgi:hypothetical protein
MTLENYTFSNKPADRCAIWQYLQGWSSIRCLPWAVPTAIEFVPFGDEIGWIEF